jgi:hypothetical protein
MSTVTPDHSPADLMRRVGGTVTFVRVTSSGRICLAATDSTGAIWAFRSWEADYSPSSPERMDGKTVVHADFDPESGVLTVRFSDETYFTLTPNRDADDESLEDWELITPDLIVAYGPKGRWQISANGSD